jgi:NitT/TauT family transport system ATP-binding protein
MTQESFVDFQNVWLAYNDELLAQNHFAVEDINLQASSSPSSALRVAANQPS